MNRDVYGKKKSKLSVYADALFNRGIYIKNTSNTPQPFAVTSLSNADF